LENTGMMIVPSSNQIAVSQSAQSARFFAAVRLVRARARLLSALVLLSFVLCHLASHITLIVSVPVAQRALDSLMSFWRTETGTYVLATALAVHVLNALWSIYIRRYLRLPAWELAQLCLGFSIPPLLTLHVVSTKISDRFLGTASDYHSVLTLQWVITPWLLYLQVAAVLTLWTHACIGLHFWLRTKRWYPAWLPILGALGVLIPALALAGYISGGNQILREAQNSGVLASIRENAHETPEAIALVRHMAFIGLTIYAGLVVLPFVGRGVRRFVYRMHRLPRLTHSNGRAMAMLPGATVLETLRANGIPHASVCGGRARCTTCRVRVVSGQAQLPPPAGLEAEALTRIGASPGVRLACQIRPSTDISVMPLLAADSRAADGLVRGGMEGSERPVAVVFIDLRGSTTLGEMRMPYDVLFILNQFFNEMTKALAATGGHYSNFTGDGLMALYGLNTPEPAIGAAQALRGASEMLTRLDQLNAQLKADLKEPLRIGISVHFGEAIVGAMGPPGSQIVTAVGDTVNTSARLESLTKDYDCPLIVSRRAAQAAGLNLVGHSLHEALIKGRAESVEFYALKTVPDAAM
jgi:adenylate cyclase